MILTTKEKETLIKAFSYVQFKNIDENDVHDKLSDMLAKIEKVAPMDEWGAKPIFIKVIVQGGVVQNVEKFNIPTDVRMVIEVNDYDVEKTDSNHCSKDKDGNLVCISIY